MSRPTNTGYPGVTFSEAHGPKDHGRTGYRASVGARPQRAGEVTNLKRCWFSGTRTGFEAWQAGTAPMEPGLVEAIAWRAARAAGVAVPAGPPPSRLREYMRRVRSDARDRGAREPHERRATDVTPRHRAAMDAAGVPEGTHAEFKHDGSQVREDLIWLGQQVTFMHLGQPTIPMLTESAPDPLLVEIAEGLGLTVREVQS